MIRDLGLLWSGSVMVLRRSMMVMVLGRWRDRVEAWRFVRPDEQHAARRVVHNESRRASEAVWAEPRVVAIPRHDEERSVLCCRDHLTFGTAAAAFPRDSPTRPSSGSRQQLGFRRARRDLNGIPRVGPTSASSEQARVGAVQALGHRWVDHVE